MNTAKTDTAPVAAFLGLGAIGGPMAERLVQAGHKIAVYDVRPEAMEPFKGRAELATSATDAANRAEIVFGCLAASEQFQTAILGPQGVIHGSKVRIYVHLGTNGVALVHELMDALQKKGVTTIDAPMTGGVAGARKGVLTVMAAGPKTAYEKVAPLMSAYAKKQVYVGEKPGAGQMVKVVNNILSLGNYFLACEAFVTGLKGGLDPKIMLDVVNNGSGQNSATLDKFPNHIMNGTFNFGGALRIALKDVKAFKGEAERLGVKIPVSAHVVQSLADAMANGSETDDITTVFTQMEVAAGLESTQARTKSKR